MAFYSKPDYAFSAESVYERYGMKICANEMKCGVVELLKFVKKAYLSEIEDSRRGRPVIR